MQIVRVEFKIIASRDNAYTGNYMVQLLAIIYDDFVKNRKQVLRFKTKKNFSLPISLATLW